MPAADLSESPSPARPRATVEMLGTPATRPRPPPPTATPRAVMRFGRIINNPADKPLTDMWEWQLDARCRDMHSHDFFHPDGDTRHHRRRREERAISVCGKCEVRADCLNHAVRNRETHGVWGGLNERQLRIAVLASETKFVGTEGRS